MSGKEYVLSNLVFSGSLTSFESNARLFLYSFQWCLFLSTKLRSDINPCKRYRRLKNTWMWLNTTVFKHACLKSISSAFCFHWCLPKSRMLSSVNAVKSYCRLKYIQNWLAESLFEHVGTCQFPNRICMFFTLISIYIVKIKVRYIILKIKKCLSLFS